MGDEPQQLLQIIQYAGLVIFGLGAVLAWRAQSPKVIQRLVYILCGLGFLMAWAGGQLQPTIAEVPLFTAPNVIGFLGLTLAMNILLWRAAKTHSGDESAASSSWISLKHFGWIEGASLVILIFVGMPLKYLAAIDAVVRYVGMAHGLLFVAFVIWVIAAAAVHRWSLEKTAGALVASVVPFGPYVADLED